MLKKFCYWIIDIIEDDPIPYEIKHIFFYVNGREVGLGGRENDSYFVDDFQYYPLEGQFFEYSKYITRQPSKLSSLKLIVEDACELQDIKKHLLGKTIHIGNYLEEVSYSFDVF